MKVMTTMILISVFFWQVAAPPANSVMIFESEVIMPYDPMLYAFQKVESNFNVSVVNWLGYTGILQIGQEMTDEANRICKLTGNPKRFTFPESALDSLQSVQIWYIVQSHWNPTYELKRACKIWNPLASERYYNKILESMN